MALTCLFLFFFLTYSMKIFTVARLLFLFLWIFYTPVCHSQDLNQIYQSKDFFKLRDEFQKQSAILTPQDRYFYQAVLENAFNQCDRSNETSAKLTANSLVRVKGQHWKMLEYLRADNYIKLYRYQEAVNCFTELKNKMNATLDSSEIDDLDQSIKLWSTIREVQPQEVIRPSECHIPWVKDKMGLIDVPVNVGDDTSEFMFDTGANQSVISETNAKRFHLKIYKVKIPLASGISGTTFQTSLAVADSLYIGVILLRHVIFFLLPDDMLYFKPMEYRQQGIIGEPVIAQLGEIKIRKDGQMDVSVRNGNPRLHNLAFSGMMPIVNFFFEQDSLPFQFDTGAGSTILYEPFFTRYRKMILQKGKSHILRSAGVGGSITESKAYELKNFHLEVAGVTCRLDTVNIRTTPVGPEKDLYYGNIGLGLFNACNTVTLNLRDMYISVN
jgi:hypothetical protein